MRIALIVNPRATRVSDEMTQRVTAALARAGKVEVWHTERARHGVELGRRAGAEADAVVVYSGDGGYGEVVNGLDRDIPIGFVPGGGTSVLPRALGQRRDPVATAGRLAQALIEGSTRRISVGVVNGYRFTFEAGIGVDAEAVRRVDEMGRDEKGRRPGDLAFMRTLIKIVSESGGRFEPKLEIRGFGSAAFAMVMNGSPATFAGPLPVHLAPEARFEDGLDLIAPVELKPGSLIGFLFSVLTARSHRRPDVIHGHDLDRIEIVCAEPLPLQADGEDLGDVSSAVFECQRSALSVIA